MQSCCFANLNLLLFCHFRGHSRRCRRHLSSLLYGEAGYPHLRGLPHLPGVPQLHVNRPFVVDLLLWFTLNLVMVYGTVQWCGERKIKINYEEMKIN